MGTITVVDFKRVEYTKIFRFSHPTVLATANTGECILPVPRRGLLTSIKIVCPTSTDFDFTLYTKAGVTYPDLDVLIYIENSNKVYSASGLEIPYYNNDTVMANKLYLYLLNTDGGNPTGIISIELGIDERGNDR